MRGEGLWLNLERYCVQALAEVAALKKTVAKHEYRIMHLIRALNEEENKHK